MRREHCYTSTSMVKRIVTVVTLLALAGCQSDVAVHPPEKRKTAFLGESLGSFVQMNQSDAEQYFVSGISGLQAQTWRWTSRQAVLRFRLASAENQRYVMKFAVPGVVLARNGPVKLDILINSTKFDELRYNKDGVYEIEKPVPPAMLKTDAENLVTIEIDKPLPADGKGPELGFILVHAGFRPAG